MRGEPLSDNCKNRIALKNILINETIVFVNGAIVCRDDGYGTEWWTE